jgi:4-amino-4-deoxy-L-arabinose transferase-like glycosyltransferase
MNMKQTLKHWLLLLCVCGIVFGFNVGERSFWGRHGEARRAEVSREMVASGDWLIPHLNGDAFITKPPLYYWAAALSFTVTGRIDELSARIPSLISGTIGVLIVAVWGSVLFSRQVGLFAGIILATNFLYNGLARTAGIDMMLTMFIMAALCCFSIGIECSRERQKSLRTFLFLLTAAWIGFGNMTKNPIGLAVPVLAIGVYILVSQEFKLLYETKPWWGLVIFLAISLPWFILVYQRVPDFFDVLKQETVGRYTDPDGTPHLEPFYYYVPSLGAFAPWVIFLPATVASLLSQGWRRLSHGHRLLVVAAVTTFVLFSSVGSKREYYLAPLYPILAMLVAKVWEEYIVLRNRTSKRWAWKSMDITIVGFAGLLVILGIALPIAANIYLPDYVGHSIGFGLLLVGAGVLSGILFVRNRPRLVFWTLTCVTIGLYLFSLSTIVPEMDRYRSRKEFFQEARSLINDHPVVDFNYEGFDVQFYLQRLIEYCHEPEELADFLDEHDSTFVILTGKRYRKLQQENPDLAARFDVRMERAWTSAVEPDRQKGLVLLQEKS